MLEEEADDHQQSLYEATATHKATEETSEVVEADMPRKDPPGEPIPHTILEIKLEVLQIGDGLLKERKAKLRCGLVATLDNVKRFQTTLLRWWNVLIYKF